MLNSSECRRPKERHFQLRTYPAEKTRPRALKSVSPIQPSPRMLPGDWLVNQSERAVEF